MATTEKKKSIAVVLDEALVDVTKSPFWSPNESDRNMEPANVVDGLFAIARGLQAVATAIKDMHKVV